VYHEIFWAYLIYRDRSKQNVCVVLYTDGFIVDPLFLDLVQYNNNVHHGKEKWFAAYALLILVAFFIGHFCQQIG
jgi:hypothetical protein